MKKGIIITILFFSIIMCSKVKADTYQNAYYFNYFSDSALTNQYPSLSGGIVSYVQLLSKRTQTPTFNDTNFYFSSTPDVRQYAGGYISFPFEFTLPIVAVNNQTTTGQWVCTTWTCDTVQNGVCARFNCTQGGTLTQNNSEIINPQIMVQAIMYYNGNDNAQHWRTCQLDKNSNSIRCPITNEMKGITRLRVSTYVYYSTDYDYYYNINVGKMVNIYADGTAQAIQDQTQQILDSNTTYNQNATQDFTNETQEVENYTQAEQDLMNDLDFNTTDMNITINPNASQFIWNIVDGLRSINGAIVLLMTSLLSIGIIKLVLGR